MAQAPQSFTDMFKNLGEQLKLPQVDVAKIMEHHQKNLDAMARSWQAVASGASEVASKQRAIFEEAVKDVTEMAKEYKPGGSPQEIMAKQTRVREEGDGSGHRQHARHRRAGSEVEQRRLQDRPGPHEGVLRRDQGERGEEVVSCRSAGLQARS